MNIQESFNFFKSKEEGYQVFGVVAINEGETPYNYKIKEGIIYDYNGNEVCVKLDNYEDTRFFSSYGEHNDFFEYLDFYALGNEWVSICETKEQAEKILTILKYNAYLSLKKSAEEAKEEDFQKLLKEIEKLSTKRNEVEIDDNHAIIYEIEKDNEKIMITYKQKLKLINAMFHSKDIDMYIPIKSTKELDALLILTHFKETLTEEEYILNSIKL